MTPVKPRGVTLLCPHSRRTEEGRLLLALQLLVDVDWAVLGDAG